MTTSFTLAFGLDIPTFYHAGVSKVKLSQPILYDSSLPVITEITYDETTSSCLNWNDLPNTVFRSNLIQDDSTVGYSFVFLSRSHTRRLFYSPQNYQALLTQINTFQNIQWLSWLEPKKLNSPLAFEKLIKACQNQKLDPFLWTFNDTKEMLSLVTNRLIGSNYTTVIGLGDSESLLNFPLLECAISKTTTLVAFKIPIRKDNQVQTLYRLQPLLFSYYNEACFTHLPIEIVIAVTTRTSIDQPSTTELLTTDCDLTRETLCLSRFLNNKEIVAYNCIKALIVNDAEKIRNLCPMKCVPANQINVFHRVNYTATLMLLQATQRLTITCSEIEIPIQNPPQIGSLILELTCNCKVTLQDQIFAAPPPCIISTHDYGRFQFLLPIQWYKGHLSEPLPFECMPCKPYRQIENKGKPPHVALWTIVSFAILIGVISLVMTIVLIRTLRIWLSKQMNANEPVYITVQ